MGFGNFLRDTLGAAAAGFLTGGPGGAVVGALGGATQSTAAAVGGQPQQRPSQPRGGRGRGVGTTGIARRTRNPSTTSRDSTGVSVQFPSVNVPGMGSLQGPSIDFSRVTQGPPQFAPQTTQEMADDLGRTDATSMMQFGDNPLIQIVMQKALKGVSNRALFQAIASGAINNGVIQAPIPLQAPDGTVERYQSPPGYRIVEVNGQKLSVLKPVAKAMGVLPSSGKTTLQKLDDLAREVQKYQGRIEKFAPKVGLKTTKRKSGVSR